jgi:hypothetical protein
MKYAQGIFGTNGDFQMARRGTSHVLRKDHCVVEIAEASGGVWAADESQLWKHALLPELPSTDAALLQAERLARELHLLPELSRPFRVGKASIGGTRFSVRDIHTEKRQDRQLDIQVTYPILVGDLPIVGGGGDFKITLGDKGRLIGYSGVWRTPREAFDVAVIDRKVADEQFRALTEKMKIESYEATLAYFSAPASDTQDFLYPVYVYRAVALFGKHRVPLRQIVLPATDFGPPIVPQKLQPSRPKRAADYIRRNRSDAAATSKNGHLRRSYARAVSSFEAGTSWIGLSGGLGGSQANAQGFVDEWSDAGWRINFNWGDANAWESDWNSDDDNWVDAADFVFYTGHANMDGWVLANTGGDGFLHFSESGASPQNPGDLWGQQDLEWTIIAACGPLQDEVISTGGGDVFQRWSGAFDGLHILMGYGAITFDNTDEGRKVAEYAKDGRTLIDAWFRTAQEIQPSTNGAAPPDGPDVWVGAMWVGKNGVDPGGDHAWGFGSVSADPRSPSWYAAMWTTC